MNAEVGKAVSAFVLAAKGTKSEGHILSQKELDELNDKLGHALPLWFIELLSIYPLSGAQLDFPCYEPDGDDDGFRTIEMATPQNIYDEMELCYPGIAIKELGYFCLALDPAGTGDQYFSTSQRGDNPPIFQVYHDVSDVGAEIEKNGMMQIAGSVSEFFYNARVDKNYS